MDRVMKSRFGMLAARIYLRRLDRRWRRRGCFLGVMGNDGVLRSVPEHERWCAQREREIKRFRRQLERR